VKAVEKVKSTDPDKVIDALPGIEVPNLTGGTSKMLANHHITKPVFIGEVRGDGQFHVVWKTPGLVPADAWSNFLPDSKDLEADWVTLKCGNYNKVTKKCGGRHNGKRRASVIFAKHSFSEPAIPAGRIGMKSASLGTARRDGDSRVSDSHIGPAFEPAFHFARARNHRGGRRLPQSMQTCKDNVHLPQTEIATSHFFQEPSGPPAAQLAWGP
jgi:hypothetical protein